MSHGRDAVRPRTASTATVETESREEKVKKKRRRKSIMGKHIQMQKGFQV